MTILINENMKKRAGSARPTSVSKDGDLPILVVDLDDSLIRTDLFFEHALAAVKIKPLVLFLIPFWLLGGRVFTKAKLTEIVQIKPKDLPYRNSVIQLIEVHKSKKGIV